MIGTDTSEARPGAQAAGGGLAELYRRHENFIKYAAIGGAASALDVAIFLVLYNVFETGALIAHSVSVPTAVLFSFFVNARHNFKTDDHMALRLLSFAVACLIGYWVGYGVIALAVEAGLGANAGKILSLPVVFVTQYILNSRITFRKARVQ